MNSAAANITQNAELRDMYLQIGMEAMRSSAMFEGSPPQMLELIVKQRSRVAQLQPGEMLQTMASSGEGIVIIVDGQAQRIGVGGQVLGAVGARSIVGEETLVGQRPSCNCRAVSEVVALVVTGRDVHEALGQYPGASSRLHQYYQQQRGEQGVGNGAPRKGMNKRDFIRAVPLFQSMPPRVVEDLQVRLTSDFFPQGAWIVTEGELGDSMYFIAEGAVEMVNTKTNAVIASLRTGEFFGEVAVLFRETRQASVRAKQPTSAFRLASTDLHAILEQYPDIKAAVLMQGEQRRAQMITGSSTPGGQVYRAVYDYAGQDGDDRLLQFSKGDEITILRKQVEAGSDWWEGKTATGTVGLLPRKYVELVHDGQAETAGERAGKKQAKIPPPTNLEVSEVTADSFTLTWKAPRTAREIDEYEISYTVKEKKGNGETSTQCTGSNETLFTLQELPADTKFHQIKMRTLSDGEMSVWSFTTEAKTEKKKKKSKQSKNKKKSKKAQDEEDEDEDDETEPGAPPPAPVLEMPEEDSDTVRTVKMLEGLQVFFGTQALFLKELVDSMKHKKYKSNETITGRSGSGKGSQKKSVGGVTVSNKDVDSMEALFCIGEGKAELLDRNGLGVRTLTKGACLLGIKSKLLSVTETLTQGQEGDIVTVGKATALVLTNGDLDQIFKKYPQSFEAVKRNSMSIRTGFIEDLILLTHEQTKAMMGQMQQAAMGDPRAGASMGGMGVMPMMGGMMGAMGMGAGMAGGTAGGGAGVQSLQSSLAGGAAPGGVGGGTQSMSAGGGTGTATSMQPQGTMTPNTGQPIRGMRTAQDAQMAVKELRDKLQWMPMMRDAPGDFLDRLVSMMTCKYVGAQTTLLREGDRGKEMAVIVEGSANIVSEIDDRKVIGTVRAGDFVGDTAVILREPQSKSIVTTEDCTVFILEAQNFQLLQTQYPQVVARMREVALLKKKQEFELSHDLDTFGGSTGAAGSNGRSNGGGGGGGGGGGVSVAKLGGAMFQDLGLSNEVGLEPILMQGVLKKKSPSLFKGWQARWFILDKHSLSWYRYKTDIRSEMRGGISMARIEQIVLHGKKGTNMQICVNNRAIFLEAETPEELEKWLRHLQPLLPRRQGALKKLKERQGFFRIKTGGYISSDWNHRFFVLQDKFLIYYDASGRNSRGSVFKGLIPLRSITDVLPVQDDPNCFRVGTPERNLHLRAVTAEEALEWIKSINDAKAALVGGTGTTKAQPHVTQHNFT